MERGLYIAATGMLAEQVRQDQIANDLANASTTGYKADRAIQSSFSDLLLSNRASGEVVGELSLGTEVAEILTDLGQGPLRETGETFDVALEGDGFLAVQTPNGVRYTRDGQLDLDAEGNLVTTVGGYAVLDANGSPITLPSPDRVTIGPAGEITVGTTAVATLGVVTLTWARKEGDTLFTWTPGGQAADTVVRQGYLEGSGVEPARTMVDMIVSLRAYEASQRVLRTIDESLGRAVTAGSTGVQ